MKAGIISCDNGLGHIRRTIIIANELSKFLQVSLIGNIKKIRKFSFKKSIKVKKWKLDFQPNKSFLTNNIISKKSKKISFKNYDFILSDNLPELTKHIKNSFIFANFFWHKEFKMNNKKYKLLERNLNTKKTVIFGNYLFSQDYLKKFNFFRTPFFGKYNKNKSANSILLSFGTAKFNSHSEVKNKVVKILKKLKSKEKIFLEPSFYNKSLKGLNVQKADYSNKMYNRISVAYIKPGMGTVEECLRRGIPVICYSKNTTNEFVFNSKIIKKNKLGDFENNLEKGIKKAINILNDNSQLKYFQTRMKKLLWQGEKKVIKVILSSKNL